MSELLAHWRASYRSVCLCHGVPRTRLLAWLLLLLWVANLCDLALTVWAMSLQRAGEANPVMGVLLRQSPAEAALFKVGLVSAVLLLLWLIRGRRVALGLAAALDVVFVALVLYEALSLVSG